jgi:hypothetical protein
MFEIVPPHSLILDDGGGIYLRNVSNITALNAMQTPESTIDIIHETWRYSE